MFEMTTHETTTLMQYVGYLKKNHNKFSRHKKFLTI
jgi:hypothetical protein